ncbi:hypothetical protein GQ54DRAFT_172038 [Martensiomyces pterosporus]|nr:hypothetical protein GQ54DRAFT_172038 [Martensiomyces pterosporus]
MQADNRAEKQEVQRVMWSPYPDHYLTLWALPPPPAAAEDSSRPTHLDTRHIWTEKQKRRHQWWQISRDFKLTTATASPSSSSESSSRSGSEDERRDAEKNRGKTTEILATHRLNFGNQSIRRLTIPSTSVQYLGSLVELRMPQNKLTSLPRSLFKLQQLEILNVENNLLDEEGVPDHLWRGMVHLRVLFLAGNLFRRLPPSLGHVPRLFYLDVSDNPRLGHLPVELLMAPAIGTLAANRCSSGIMDRLCQENGLMDAGVELAEPLPSFLPLVDTLPLSQHGRSVRVPALADICIRQIHTAISPFTDENGSQAAASTSGRAAEKQRHDGGGRHLFAACEEMRRNPGDYVVSGVLLKPLDSAGDLCACSVCGEPVFYPSFGIVKAVDHWALPFSWQCCSAKCRDTAADMVVQKKPDYI